MGVNLLTRRPSTFFFSPSSFRSWFEVFPLTFYLHPTLAANIHCIYLTLFAFVTMFIDSWIKRERERQNEMEKEQEMFGSICSRGRREKSKNGENWISLIFLPSPLIHLFFTFLPSDPFPIFTHSNVCLQMRDEMTKRVNHCSKNNHQDHHHMYFIHQLLLD